MYTNLVGDGVVPGAAVMLSGIAVGKVDTISATSEGQQLITLALQPEKVVGLTDAFDVDYAPSNLFGISAVVLKRQTGGAPLRMDEVVDLTGGERVADVTVGKLMRELSTSANQVFTPQLTDLMRRAATDLAAFTPTLEALVSVGRAIADTQRYPSSFLIAQYGEFIKGVAAFSGSTIELISEVYSMEVLRNEGPLFDTGVTLVVDQLFPMISDVLWTANKFVGNADGTTTLLHQLSLLNPYPERTRLGAAELIKRINEMFVNTATGTELNVPVKVILRDVPVIAEQLPETPPASAAEGR
ncbi:Mce family protein [Mycobacteroides chelonae]|uniref:Mce family protein n=1 Tax=Mycobacteroides chelonae TaxID=1774 RepID=A0A1S1MDD6_MYCCH|nr:Mce family protein [Mycobacteroides chelonae]OHU80553.1 Mce family protein [Mycobacteroides chelonae]QQG90156.1 Mce family protein [Mycobacteroides chelonae]QQG94972.1 Mce family protein [Mycobacteroides chelonae]